MAIADRYGLRSIRRPFARSPAAVRGDRLHLLVDARLLRPVPPSLERPINLQLGPAARGAVEGVVLRSTEAGERGQLGIVATAATLVAPSGEQRSELGLPIQQLGLAAPLVGVMDHAGMARVLLAATHGRPGG
jgi:hypothetical protein